MQHHHSSLCPICGGRKEPGTATYTADLGKGVIVVRNVKAVACSQCGEEWIDNETAKELERLTQEARAHSHQIEVVVM